MGDASPKQPKRVVVDDNVAQGMRRIGVSEEDIATLQAELDPVAPEVDCEVHEDCWASVMFFAALETQWRWVAGGMARGERTGLDYTAVLATMQMRGMRQKQRPALLDDVRAMEREALRVMREQASIANQKG